MNISAFDEILFFFFLFKWLFRSQSQIQSSMMHFRKFMSHVTSLISQHFISQRPQWPTWCITIFHLSANCIVFSCDTWISRRLNFYMRNWWQKIQFVLNTPHFDGSVWTFDAPVDSSAVALLVWTATNIQEEIEWRLHPTTRQICPFHRLKPCWLNSKLPKGKLGEKVMEIKFKRVRGCKHEYSILNCWLWQECPMKQKIK